MRNIHSRLAVLTFAAIGLAAAAHDRPAQSADHNRPAFVFHSIDVPGATSTNAWDMNSRGDIVGSYRDASGNRHGYLLSDGIFTTFDHPDAVYTDPRGINAGGEIVGAYARDQSEFTEIDVFGSEHNGATPDGHLRRGPLYERVPTGSQDQGSRSQGGQRCAE
jgi:uncharacterized membrane protein